MHTITADCSTHGEYHDIIPGDHNSLPHNESHGLSPKHSKSPRCEAFVMTGDKMLNLNPKISPHYAKMRQDQIPPIVAEVHNGEGVAKRRGPFDDFPSLQHKTSKHRRFHGEYPPSQSEDGLTSDNMTNGEYAAARQPSSSTAPTETATKNYSASTLPENILQSTISQVDEESKKLSNYIDSRFTASQSMPASPAKRIFDPSGTSYRIMPNRDGSSVSAKSNDLYANSESVARLAMQLFSLQGGLKVSDAARFLMKTDEFSQRVAADLMAYFNFSGKRLDAALREFLDHVCLSGESSDRARLLMVFSNRYQECNPALFSSVDEIHALTCALILLNTDLHGPNPGKKMTCREFVNNLLHTQYTFDRNMLKTLYNSIKDLSFQCHSATLQKSQVGGSIRASETGSVRHSLLINPNEQVDYKHGWVLKKSVYDADGKRTPFGRRKWIMQFATIRGMVLYLHKDENGFTRSRHEIFNNCVRLHHSLAEIPKDYTKKPYVFRLRTADLGEILFQTSEPEEVQQWINALNYVAAAFSTPVMPAPVSSTGTVEFKKPMMPSTPTSLSISEQLRSHQERLEEMIQRLEKLREDAPSIKAKGKPVYDYFYRERYLDKERERYNTYVTTLAEKLGATSQIDVSSLASTSKKNSLIAIRHNRVSISHDYSLPPQYEQRIITNAHPRQATHFDGSSETFCSMSRPPTELGISKPNNAEN
ncbi:pleckstrin homology domain-containing protein [Ditylenchus destructor]|uniref:Pleckstrin homology domain-containing protein n=1 Tax=Ditylenchus destructor TaxID=166010 RepID=A0AAD4NE07_9BILA|nr:pleckstrin homology domain-containing protein [Ditylenchus destructor]